MHFYTKVNQIALNVIIATEYMKVVDLVYLIHMNDTPHIAWVSTKKNPCALL